MKIDRRMMKARREEPELVRRLCNIYLDTHKMERGESLELDREEVKQLIKNRGQAQKPYLPAILAAYSSIPLSLAIYALNTQIEIIPKEPLIEATWAAFPMGLGALTGACLHYANNTSLDKYYDKETDTIRKINEDLTEISETIRNS